jgi:hypothetical protein
MSGNPEQQGHPNATLTLENAASVSGNLSLLLDGRLQLRCDKPIAPMRSNTGARLTAGVVATLSVSDSDAAALSLGDARVKVSDIRDETITLEFAQGEGELAARYRKALSGRFTRGSVRTADSTPGGSSSLTPAPAGTHGTRKAASHAVAMRPPKPLLTAVTAEYAALLDAVEAQSLIELKAALTPFFLDLANHLRGVATSMIKLDSGDHFHMGAANILQRRAANIAARIIDHLTHYYRDLVPEHDEDQLWQYNIGSTDELNLIGVKEFEDFLVIDRMVSHGEELHKLALEALTLRLAVLIDADPNRVRLPVHVRQLCRAFQRALMDEDVPQSVLNPIYDYFSKRFITQLAEYYEPLNNLLADNRVLPNIENEIRNKGTLLKRDKRVPRPEPKVRKRRGPDQEQLDAQRNAIAPITSALKELNQIHQQLGEQLGSVLVHARPADLYRSVVDALNFKREAEGLADGNVLAKGVAISGTWDGATVASTELDQTRVADAQSIARALSAMQRIKVTHCSPTWRRIASRSADCRTAAA